jgi:hypothetical protein
MTDPDAFRWYQARLGFWQAIWVTLITGGRAVASPGAVEAYKIFQERKLKELELAGKRLEFDQQYVSNFLNIALNPDVEARIRFSQYFSFVASEQYRDAWKGYLKAVKDRRDELFEEINKKQVQLEHLRAKTELTVDEQSQLNTLERELGWRETELGRVNRELANR